MSLGSCVATKRPFECVLRNSRIEFPIHRSSIHLTTALFLSNEPEPPLCSGCLAHLAEILHSQRHVSLLRPHDGPIA